MTANHTVLFSFAHPDDETFYAAGTIVQCRHEGARVVLVCATRGHRGNCGDPPLCSIEELPQVREQELEAASEILGICELHVLPYEDQKLYEAKPDEIRATLVRLIRVERPNVVITFDPNGGNVHTDHVAISRFTIDAAVAAADPRWYPETGSPFSVPRLLWTPAVQPWKIDAGTAAQSPGVDFLIDVSEWREQKRAALRAHKTQNPGITRIFFAPGDSRPRFLFEAFRQAWGPKLQERPARSIFE